MRISIFVGAAAVALALGCPNAVGASPADVAFEKVAHDTVEYCLRAGPSNSYLQLGPEGATALGDHRFDDELSDYSAAHREQQLGIIRAELAALRSLDHAQLSGPNRVDAQVLTVQLQLWQFSIEDEREYAWNPLSYNNSLANSVYLLIARDFAPPEARLRAARKRLEGIPRVIAQIKANLKNPPRIHTETAIKQTAGAIDLVEHGFDALLAEAPQFKDQLAPAQKQAADALAGYKSWLEHDVLPKANGDFRLGADRFRQKLKLTLDSELSPEDILAGAERELAKATDELYETAVELYRRDQPDATAANLADHARVIRAVFDRLAQKHADDTTVVAHAKAITTEATDFVRAHDLVTLPSAPLAVIELPEFQRGVAIAYCDPPGALEPMGRTFYEVSPTPSDWTPERKASFFREYNDYMLRDLTVHEAMPGHYVQLAHSNQFKAPTLVRAVWSSGSFVEGWAVYAEQLMAQNGYGGPEVRMQQLKMRIRAIINSILDQKIHMGGMTERQALDLMMNQGFQEEGEAVGKWRRACQSSTQLSTYFVGALEHDAMRAAAEKKWGAAFNLKEYHDKILSFGSPPVKYVRQELGL